MDISLPEVCSLGVSKDGVHFKRGGPTLDGGGEHVEELLDTLAELLDLVEGPVGGALEELPAALVILLDEVVEIADAVGDGDDDVLVVLVDPHDVEDAGGLLVPLGQDHVGEVHGGGDLGGERVDNTLPTRNILEELGLVVGDDLCGVKDTEDGLADVSHFFFKILFFTVTITYFVVCFFTLCLCL